MKNKRRRKPDKLVLDDNVKSYKKVKKVSPKKVDHKHIYKKYLKKYPDNYIPKRVSIIGICEICGRKKCYQFLLNCESSMYKENKNLPVLEEEY